ncbi:MAG: delta-lactam-biosynthetic de-N-acetylase [Syntrophomonadaceae bacterium]|jgi:peptidoglycan-N-acetylmuramic acid deacetylase|nr:delta-lactam-biosynthetic de-N-acetylase [Syntrophomonadaceae bacterium]
MALSERMQQIMKKTACLFFIALAILIFSLPGCQQNTAVHPRPVPQETAPSADKPPSLSEELPVAVEVPANPVSANNETLSWYYVRNQDHKTPGINTDIAFSLRDYDAYYIGSKDPVIFLTFDEGYENGYTAEILDTLKSSQVPAAFFVTGPYISSNPELVQRMVEEGHIVGNHSQTHPSMPSKANDLEAFKREITDVENSFQEITGTQMAKFFRPPRGEYSEKSLSLTKEMGYKTIFWSFAYQDWLVDQQPDPEEAYRRIMQGTHNGQIMLLHAVSSTNTQILDRIIKDIKNEGYRFAPLTELE